MSGAMRYDRNCNVEYICADVLQHRFDPATFDAVVSVATLHHLGTEAGLLRLREWVRPGGTLGIVGLAAGDYPRDLLWDIAGAIGTRVHKLNKRYWEHAAMTSAEARDQGRPLCSSNASPSMRSR